MSEIDTHGLRVGFGKQHKGELYTRVPVSYLRWMVNVRSQEWRTAEAELARRGFTEPPRLEVSGHAIDRASVRCGKNWKDHRRRINGEYEGLHAWLLRVSAEALEMNLRVPGSEKIIHLEARLSMVFQHDTCWPILKTIYSAKAGELKAAEQAKNTGDADERVQD